MSQYMFHIALQQVAGHPNNFGAGPTRVSMQRSQSKERPRKGTMGWVGKEYHNYETQSWSELGNSYQCCDW